MYQTTLFIAIPAYFKICIGFSQVLVMVELTIRVDQSTMVIGETRRGAADESYSSRQTRAKVKRLDRRVLIFRGIMSAICLVVLIFALASIIAVQIETNKLGYTLWVHEIYSVYVGLPFSLFLFLTVGALLAVSIGALIFKLRRKKRRLLETDVANVFGKEIRNLIVILLVFDLSFLLREVSDAVLLQLGLLPRSMLKDWGCQDADGQSVMCYPYPIAMYNFFA